MEWVGWGWVWWSGVRPGLGVAVEGWGGMMWGGQEKYQAACRPPMGTRTYWVQVTPQYVGFVARP